MGQETNDPSMQKPLPDILAHGMKILFIGYNPGITSAATGHHYAHKSNRFWRLLHDSGLTPSKYPADNDRLLLDLGFGSTNIIDRPSVSTSDIKSKELTEGAKNLGLMIEQYKPYIACYVGLGVYKAFASAILGISVGRIEMMPGLQSRELVPGTRDYVCYNPSGLNTIPYQEQLDLFVKLKALAYSQ